MKNSIKCHACFSLGLQKEIPCQFHRLWYGSRIGKNDAKVDKTKLAVILYPENKHTQQTFNFIFGLGLWLCFRFLFSASFPSSFPLNIYFQFRSCRLLLDNFMQIYVKHTQYEWIYVYIFLSWAHVSSMSDIESDVETFCGIWVKHMNIEYKRRKHKKSYLARNDSVEKGECWKMDGTNVMKLQTDNIVTIHVKIARVDRILWNQKLSLFIRYILSFHTVYAVNQWVGEESWKTVTHNGRPTITMVYMRRIECKKVKSF